MKRINANPLTIFLLCVIVAAIVLVSGITLARASSSAELTAFLPFIANASDGSPPGPTPTATSFLGPTPSGTDFPGPTPSTGL